MPAESTAHAADRAQDAKWAGEMAAEAAARHPVDTTARRGAVASLAAACGQAARAAGADRRRAFAAAVVRRAAAERRHLAEPRRRAVRRPMAVTGLGRRDAQESPPRGARSSGRASVPVAVRATWATAASAT